MTRLVFGLLRIARAALDHRIDALIGRGGMADVFRGTDLRLHRPVAVKLMRRDLARDPHFQARFRKEARSVASLNHPSIVSVYDTGEVSLEDGHHPVDCPYLVMELVDGPSLAERLAEGADHAGAVRVGEDQQVVRQRIHGPAPPAGDPQPPRDHPVQHVGEGRGGGAGRQRLLQVLLQLALQCRWQFMRRKH